MKNVSAELQAHLASESVTLATCWKLTRTDNVVMGFTDHDTDLVIDAVTYEAASGFTPSAVATNANLASDNLDLQGLLDSEGITEEDIMAGLYDFAEIEIFQVNYKDLTQGVLHLRRGQLGEVSLKNHQFTAEVRGLNESLNQKVGNLYSPLCRAILGDARCKVNLAAFTVTGTVTGVTNNRIFTDENRGEDTGWFNFGTITFTSGNNNGLTMEVKEFIAGGDIILVLPMSFAVRAGDTYSMVAGCDKTPATCKAKFNNILNFRGEPDVPGTDHILKTSGTR